MKLLDTGRRESQETPEQTLARLNAGTCTATPVNHVPTKPSEGLGERLARISQRRWRLICVTFWPCVALVAVIVFGLVDAYRPISTSDDAGVAAYIMIAAAAMTLWVFGVTRTEHMDPAERTTIQRASKYMWEHLPHR